MPRNAEWYDTRSTRRLRSQHQNLFLFKSARARSRLSVPGCSKVFAFRVQLPKNRVSESSHSASPIRCLRFSPRSPRFSTSRQFAVKSSIELRLGAHCVRDASAFLNIFGALSVPAACGVRSAVSAPTQTPHRSPDASDCSPPTTRSCTSTASCASASDS